MRTFHPHWAKCSGYNQFIRYINKKEFTIIDDVVPMGEDNFPFKHRRIIKIVNEFIKRNNFKVYALNDLMAELKAFRHWLSGKIDLFHYLEGEHSLQYLPKILNKIKSEKVKTPIVATFHQPPDLLKKWVPMDIIRQLDHVIVLSPNQYDYLCRYLPAEKVSLVLHGVDTDYFCPKQNKIKGTFKCLIVGQWLRDYPAVLEVAQRSLSYPELEFHIVASGIHIPNQLTNVYLYKDISDDDLIDLYQNSDVLFLPLKDSTANNVILESISCGLPVISSNLSGVRAYLSGEESILIDKNSTEAFLDAIISLYKDPDICYKMGKAARKRSIELSWENVVPKLEEIYSSLIK
jgi:glycosyltransferase involved in cell wall biosynthesis